MKKADGFWLFALPVYLLIGTARHELSHAAAAMMEGARVTKIWVLPSVQPLLGFCWGYADYEGGDTTWLTTAAPYFCDVAMFAIFVPLCVYGRRWPRWVWLNCLVIGVASPLADVVNAYQTIYTRDTSDAIVLLSEFPHWAVHAAYLGLIVLFAGGTWYLIRERARQGASENVSRLAR